MGKLRLKKLCPARRTIFFLMIYCFVLYIFNFFVAIHAAAQGTPVVLTDETVNSTGCGFDFHSSCRVSTQVAMNTFSIFVSSLRVGQVWR